MAKPRPLSIKHQHPCDQCPLKKHDILRDLSASETEFMTRFKTGEFQAQAGSTIIVEGTNSPHLYTVLSGWGFRYKTLPDGRRQILNFILPGDLVGLQGSLMKEMSHSVEALSDMMFCVFERESLTKLFKETPSLAYDVTWLAAREEQMLDEHLLSVGRRTAIERAAYLISFLSQRARRVGQLEDGQILVPFTQSHVADTLGLSLVHTNKTLKKLQARGLIKWSERSCIVKDEEKLQHVAGWDGLPDTPRPFI
ncbi:Crp/Fnr family transcriptional regulator [Pseudahrensia aquimaris]|uniref:Crp/Fnr family transcriptional regulator n=1 Tax=Pseudahrensia aquimaris TaxID=744461 RepID=A0ABW3FFH9_9HYPH